MSFARIEYLPFLGLLLLLWPFLPANRRTAALLLASYVFYLWVRPWNAVWLIASTLLDFGIGRALGKAESQRRRKVYLWVSVTFNLALLGTFKYAAWIAANLQALGLPVPGVEALQGLALPLGISFYTFQTLSYTIDVYRRRIKPCTNLLEYGLYVAFFPQLVAGPIERAAHLLPQLRRLAPLTGANLSSGLCLIFWGLVKKSVIGDRLMGYVWPVFREPLAMDSLSAVISATGMLTILYLDFSAYTDLARGSARLFGVELVRNFQHPFLSTSLHEWTRRWHMSLQTWIVDYVHLPLARGKPTHSKIWYSNLIVMGLFGLWHGASWTFLFWGLSYGVFVSIEHSRRLHQYRRGIRSSPSTGGRRWSAVLVPWLFTLLLSIQFVVLFFSPDLHFALDYFLAQVSWTLPASGERWAWCAWTAAGLLALLAVHAATARWDPRTLWGRAPGVGRGLALVAAAALVFLGRVAHPRPFVYFDF